METKLNSDHSHTLWASWRAPDSERHFLLSPVMGQAIGRSLGTAQRKGEGECYTPFCSQFWLWKTQDSTSLLSRELETKSSDIRLRILSINPLDSDLLRSLEGLGCYQQKEHAQPQTQKTEFIHPWPGGKVWLQVRTGKSVQQVHCEG